MGALGRRFERDRAFMGEYSTAPGATAAGGNENMALRFGDFQSPKPPKMYRVMMWHIAIGAATQQWLTLSDLEWSSVSWPRFGVAWS